MSSGGGPPETAAAAAARPWLAHAPAPLHLDLLGDPEEEPGLDERDYDSVDTPRDLLVAHAAQGLPSSPRASQRKTKSRAAHALARHGSFTSRNSLKDNKVLLVTGIKRSDSLLQPDLFLFHNHFEFLGVVGRTHLSEVFRVRHRQTGELYAVKRSRRRFKSKLHRERCLREISAVAQLPGHPHIVGQYRAWQEGGHFYIQMDLCEGGNLHQLVAAANAEGSLLSDEELWTVLWEVASGLEFLHSHGVLHLDIKPENIYRDRQGVCQIGDFGLAVGVGTKEWWEEGDGDYVAPELLRHHGAPSPAADIYSLGATLYECATGVKLVRQLQEDSSPAEATLPGRPPALEALMQRMLAADPAQRPSASQILEFIEEQGVPLLVEPAGAEGCCAAAALEAGGAVTATPTPNASPSVLTFMGAGAAGALASPFASSREEGGESRPAGEAGVPPCPFLELSQESSGEEVAQSVAQQQQQQQAAAAAAFSFAPLPPPPEPLHSVSPAGLLPGGGLLWRQPGGGSSGAEEPEDGGSAAATPLARPPRSRGRPGMASAAARRAAAAMGGVQRWVPSLSPLISEGALTPGALEGLSPCPMARTASRAEPGSGSAMMGPSPREAPHSRSTPGSGRSTPMLSLPGSGPGSGQRARRSTDSRGDGWRLSRRDMISPDSDALARSVDSDLYSFSCGTGGSMSSLEFMDTGISQPTSPEFQSAPAEQSNTPDLFTARAAQAAAAEGGQGAGGAAAAAPGQLPFQPSMGLAWDLHTSPEFLMQLPPGSPISPAATEDSQQHSRSFSSIRRFPTLDSMESMQLEGGGKADCGGARPQRLGSFNSIPQRLTSSFGQPEPGAAAPAVPARKRPLSRHSSRRGLLSVLSREGSLASCGSLDQLQLGQRMRREEEDCLESAAGGCGGDPGGYLGRPGELLLGQGQGEQAEEVAGGAWGGGGGPVVGAAVWARGLRAVGSSSSLLGPGSRATSAGAGAILQQQPQPSPLRERITGMTLSDGAVC